MQIFARKIIWGGFRSGMPVHYMGPANGQSSKQQQHHHHCMSNHRTFKYGVEYVLLVWGGGIVETLFVTWMMAEIP